MTVVGVITTIGILLALAYALRVRADNVVYHAWAWLFSCLCASTGAVVNNAAPEHYLWWYGIPATIAVPALLIRFIRCKCMTIPNAAFISLFGVNTLALAMELDGVHLFAGVTLLAVTVWAQIILLFFMAKTHPCPDEHLPEIREQKPYGKKKDSAHIEQISPAHPTLWWWEWLRGAISNKYPHLHLPGHHDEKEPKNGTTG